MRMTRLSHRTAQLCWVLLAPTLLVASPVAARPVTATVTAKTFTHSLDGPLSEAIVARKAERVQILLQRGADPNAKTPDDSATPMSCLAAAVGEPLEIA